MIVTHALLILGVLGCRRGELAGGMTDSTFVTTMVALRRINADEARDSASRAAARDSVLQGRDLTPALLEQAAAALAEDPDRALRVWTRIVKESEPGSGD
jgi:hypothetical protein